jgi:hypothetical protein
MAYATDSISGLLNGMDSKFGWLRGLDLNQRPLGYESYKMRNINELESVVGSFKER